jgi:LuxR family transcriptional regulator, maltose regulon positive regulatory protein
VHLSARHMPRPRLTGVLAGCPVGIVEAGGGYGKSVLAAELATELGIARAHVMLRDGDGDPQALVGRLRTALGRAGLTDAAARLTATRAPPDAFDDLVEHLDGWTEPLLIVVDDVARASRSGRLLAQLAEGLHPPHRLLLAGRHLPPDLETMRSRVDVARLDTDDLAFTVDEVTALVQAYGVALTRSSAARLQRLTGGWASALSLAAVRLARSAGAETVLAELEQQPTVLHHLVLRALDHLPEDTRLALAQVAHLPALHLDVVRAATGCPDLLQLAVDAGLPLTIGSAGTAAFPEPVRELLVVGSRLDPSTARAAARVYDRNGAPLLAASVLLTTGLVDEAATLLSALPPRRLDAIDGGHFERLVSELPEAVREAHPRLLLRQAAVYDATGRSDDRAAVLRQAELAAERVGDAALTREVEAEFAVELTRAGHHFEAAALTAKLLADAEEGERMTRARAAEVRAHIMAAPMAPYDLERAERRFETAAHAWRRLGEPSRVAIVLADRAEKVDLARGAHGPAVVRFTEALTLIGAGNRLRADVLVRRARALVECGRYTEAEADLEEALELATVTGEPRVAAAVAMIRATAASQKGEAEETQAQLALADRSLAGRGDLLLGGVQLAEAAQALDRVGASAAAWAYLEGAHRGSPGEAVALTIAEGALHARSGDAVRAEELLAGVLADDLAPREAWRVQLLRAYAALRAGTGAAGVFAARALEAAARLPTAGLPQVREAAIVDDLLPAAHQQGLSVDAGLDEHDLPLAITLLGEFTVARGGRQIAVPVGRTAQLVRYLAVRGGRAHVDEVTETLWPDDPDLRGRDRIRNVLSRLRRACGDLVHREGEVLELPPNVRIDLVSFERDARDALAAPDGPQAVGLARSAASRYRGELLPDDRYSQWTVAPREHARSRLLDVLDLLVADAEARDDLDEALRLLGRAIDHDPDNEDRHLHAAELLLSQGRRGSARQRLAQAHRLADEFGAPRPPSLDDLERRRRDPHLQTRGGHPPRRS